MTQHRRIHLPGLVDLTFVNDATSIIELNASPALDRDFAAKGPLLNRILASRIRRTLVVGAQPFPAVAPKNFPGRAARQVALEAKLKSQCQAFDADIISAIATEVINPGRDLELARLAQHLTGRSFIPTFVATAETWAAAETLDMAVQSNNPLRQLVWKLSGKTTKARSLLAENMKQDPVAVHAIGIAIHNLVLSLKRMRVILKQQTDVDRIVTLSLAAPPRVLRQATGPSNGLFVMELEKCRAKTLRRDIAFMQDTWSSCPAHAWVPAALTAVAREALRRQT
jgi:hypothetical protein